MRSFTNHDSVRVVLFAMFQVVGIHVVKEAPIFFTMPSDIIGHSLRPADILLPRWTDRLPARVEVTGSSPVSLRNGIC